MNMGSKRVAIIGSGCSGIGALWALKNCGHDVHLYEAADRLGGHTNTVDFRHGDRIVKVDTGFIVMNTTTYPNFIAFLRHLGIPTLDTEMTFGISRDDGAFEWAGTSLSSVFAQKRNIVDPSMWRMIFDIIRFNQYALDLLSEEDTDRQKDGHPPVNGEHKASLKQEETIGEYLYRNNYSAKFRDDYLIPMTACVWSTSPDKCSLEFPALTLIRFLWNHHLLNTLSARSAWMTIPGGTQQYIDAVMKDFPKDRVHLGTAIESIQSDSGSVSLRTATGFTETFDHVIVATHGDEALELIQKGATKDEVSILSTFKTSTNTAVLHSDLSLMPKSRETWSSWNYLTRTNRTSKVHTPATISLTYNMNILQHISTSSYGPVLVTLNPPHEPAPHLTQGTYTYRHPIYNVATVSAQKQLSRVQNTRRISYCGAWTGYGFHEDGFTSGLRVAVEHLEGKVPFEIVDSTYARGKRTKLRSRDRVARLIIWAIQGLILLWGWFLRLISIQFSKLKKA